MLEIVRFAVARVWYVAGCIAILGALSSTANAQIGSCPPFCFPSSVSTSTSDHGVAANQGAVQSTVSSVRLRQEEFRDAYYYTLKNAAAGGATPFAGNSARQTIYASGGDPFESLALGYAKGMPTKAPRKAAAAMPSYLVSAWVQGSSDYEERTYASLGLAAVTKNQSNTIVAGMDVIKIGIATASDALVIGAFYTDTSTHTAQTSGGVGLNPTATRSVTPGGGIYASYIAGGFSTDFSWVYAQTNSRFAGIGGQPGAGFGFEGFRDTDSNTFSANMQYKYDVTKDWWVEPTVGFSVTMQHANQIPVVAFTDGNTRRFQGGVRVGTEWSYGSIRVQPTLAGIAYSDVDVETITGVGTVFVLPTDEGYLWGKGLGKVNVQWTDKFSTSAEGEVRGRSDVIGYAGRLMARYTF